MPKDEFRSQLSNVRVIDRNRNIQWAAIVMSREIDLFAQVAGSLDEITVAKICDHLERVARGEEQALGLQQ
jgi:hypothetical protein